MDFATRVGDSRRILTWIAGSLSCAVEGVDKVLLCTLMYMDNIGDPIHIVLSKTASGLGDLVVSSVG